MSCIIHIKQTVNGTSFFYLQMIFKMRNILSQSDAEKFVNEKIRAFIALGWTIVIHYYSSLQKLHKKNFS